MITRPLFDAPPAKPARRARSTTPLLPVPTKAPRECWRITVVPTGDGPPAIIRVRRMLKSAIRGHKLRAVCVECLGTVATVSDSAHDVSPDGPRGPQIAANRVHASGQGVQATSPAEIGQKRADAND